MGVLVVRLAKGQNTMNKYLKEKKALLIKCLDDADRRFNIAISRIKPIKDRIDELETLRNLELRKEFLIKEIEIQKLNNPLLSRRLQLEFDCIDSDKNYIFTYEEVIRGYKSMSRRKNELEEERNSYVKDIEAIKWAVLITKFKNILKNL